MYTPMLDCYQGEYVVSRVNINNALQEPTRRCQNCNTRILQATIDFLNTRQNKTCIYILAKNVYTK